MNTDGNKVYYQEEQEKIFTQFLEDFAFHSWRTGESTYLNSNFVTLELILFPTCDYKCKYCYITNYGEELNPPIDGETSELIVNNTKKILDWIKRENFEFETIDLFSGELFSHAQWEDIFSILFDSLCDGKKYAKSINIPSNMHFCANEETMGKVDDWIRRFDSIGVKVRISASVDGLKCDEIGRLRRNTNDSYSKEFYDSVFSFVSRHHFGFHPMVSADNVQYWGDNLTWFLDMAEKHQLVRQSAPCQNIPPKNRLEFPYMLEVRNDNWTVCAINSYEKFQYFKFDELLRRCFCNDMEWFASYLLHLPDMPFDTYGQYSGLQLIPSTKLTCSIQNRLFVRPRYMDIVPCHRTSYKQFQFGSFKEENGIITGFKPNNIPLMMKILTSKPSYSFPKCSSCVYNEFCSYGCLGANYESTGDLFITPNSVCQLSHVKLQTIAELYHEHHVLDYAASAVEKYSRNKEGAMKLINYMEGALCRIRNAWNLQ